MSSSSPSSSSRSGTSGGLYKFLFPDGIMSPGVSTLCFCSITHTYLLFSVYPYAGYMSVFLLHRDDDNDDDNSNRVTVDNVALYAGLLGTAFTAGRALSFLPWRFFRHHASAIGGGNYKAGLLYSLALSAICSLWFGLSTSYAAALTARFFLGLVNTVSGCVKRAAIDRERARRRRPSCQIQLLLDKYGNNNSNNNNSSSPSTRGHQQQRQEKDVDVDDDGAEEHAVARVLSVMWWGSALGPALGGLLSYPGTYGVGRGNGNDNHDNDNNSGGESHDHWMDRYPFLLPNAAGALFCVLSMIAVVLFVKGESKECTGTASTTANATATSSSSAMTTMREEEEEGEAAEETTPLVNNSNNNDDNSTGGAHQQRRQVSTVGIPRDAVREMLVINSNTRTHLIAYWSFSFVVVCIDEALPLFLIARKHGPGLSERSIGWILSAAGLLVALSHSVPVGQERFFSEDGVGLYPSLRLAAFLGNVPAALFALFLTLNGGGTYHELHHHDDAPSGATNANSTTNLEELYAEEEFVSFGFSENADAGRVTWIAFIFAVAVLGLMRVFDSLYFAVVGIAVGRTVPPQHRNEAARLMTLGALVARAIAPAVAGLLVRSFMTSSKGDDDSSAAAATKLWLVIGLVFGVPAAVWTCRLDAFASVAFITRLFGGGGSGRGRVGRNVNLNAANTNVSAAALTDSCRQRDKRRNKYLRQRQRAADVFEKLWDLHHDKKSPDTVGAKWRRIARKTIIMNRIMAGATKQLESIHEDEETEDLGPRPQSRTDNVQEHHKRRSSWVDHLLLPGVDPDEVSFFIMGTTKNDASCMPHVLTPPLMEALHRHLPMSIADSNFWLKYSLVRDGTVIATLEAKTGLSKPTFVAIETLEGNVFGCFMSKPWERTNEYKMSGESFLWRMKNRRTAKPPGASKLSERELKNLIAEEEGHIEVYRWTGENDLCMLLGDDKIAAGGGTVESVSDRLSNASTCAGDGFGFVVEDGLMRGSSSPCTAYDNPCLVDSQDGRFEVANMEIWAMTPFLFVADAEKSEQDLQYMKENVTSTTWRETPSTQSAWSNFL